MLAEHWDSNLLSLLDVFIQKIYNEVLALW